MHKAPNIGRAASLPVPGSPDCRYPDTYKRRGQARSALGDVQGALEDLGKAAQLLADMPGGDAVAGGPADCYAGGWFMSTLVLVVVVGGVGAQGVPCEVTQAVQAAGWLCLGLAGVDSSSAHSMTGICVLVCRRKPAMHAWVVHLELSVQLTCLDTLCSCLLCQLFGWPSMTWLLPVAERGMLYQKQRDYRRAVKELTKATNLDPNNSVVSAGSVLV